MQKYFMIIWIGVLLSSIAGGDPLKAMDGLPAAMPAPAAQRPRVVAVLKRAGTLNSPCLFLGEGFEAFRTTITIAAKGGLFRPTVLNDGLLLVTLPLWARGQSYAIEFGPWGTLCTYDPIPFTCMDDLQQCQVLPVPKAEWDERLAKALTYPVLAGLLGNAPQAPAAASTESDLAPGGPPAREARSDRTHAFGPRPHAMPGRNPDIKSDPPASGLGAAASSHPALPHGGPLPALIVEAVAAGAISLATHAESWAPIRGRRPGGGPDLDPGRTEPASAASSSSSAVPAPPRNAKRKTPPEAATTDAEADAEGALQGQRPRRNPAEGPGDADGRHAGPPRPAKEPSRVTTMRFAGMDPRLILVLGEHFSQPDLALGCDLDGKPLAVGVLNDHLLLVTLPAGTPGNQVGLSHRSTTQNGVRDHHSLYLERLTFASPADLPRPSTVLLHEAEWERIKGLAFSDPTLLAQLAQAIPDPAPTQAP